MHVAAFVGSPRVGGNTETLVSEVLRGAREAGARTTQFALNRLDISPCQGCDACRQLGRCRIEDDMQSLFGELLGAEALVIGTPIYFWGPSAQTKAFLDRWYAIDQKGIREQLAGKRILLVCAFADAEPDTARNAVDIVRTGAAWFDMAFEQPLWPSPTSAAR